MQAIGTPSTAMEGKKTMQSIDQARRDMIDGESLIPLVGRALGVNPIELISWSFAPLEQGSVGEGTALYRLTGEAAHAGSRSAWSIVLKVLSELPNQSDPSAWYYWQREAHFYSSRLAHGQDGLQPARCFLVEERRISSNGVELWLWLEDLGELDSSSWSASDFGFAANKIGEFSGKYLMASAQPDYAWLCQDGIVSFVEQLAPFFSRLQETRNDPLLLQQLGAGPIEHIFWHWEQRSYYAELLRFAPQTLCHFDANRRNLFLVKQGTQNEAVIAIDWSYVGFGPVGADILILVVDSLYMGMTALEDVERVASDIIDQYLAGLHQAGWTGSVDLVRLGYAVAAVYYRLGGLGVMLDLILDEERRQRFEATTGLPLAALLEHNRNITIYLDKLLDEARMLYGRLQPPPGHLPTDTYRAQ